MNTHFSHQMTPDTPDVFTQDLSMRKKVKEENMSEVSEVQSCTEGADYHLKTQEHA